MVHIAWIYIRDKLINLGFIDEDDASAIDNLIINHDDSKLQRDEFIPYAKRYNGPKKKNPLIKNNFKNACRLHKGRNIHHYEKLKTYKGTDWKNYAIELVCDYIAMGWEFNNYVTEIRPNIYESVVLAPNTDVVVLYYKSDCPYSQQVMTFLK